MTIREQIKKDIGKAVHSSQFTVHSDQIEVTRTVDPRFGDYTTNIALRMTPHLRGVKAHLGGGREVEQSPLEIARVLTDSLKDQPYVEKLEVAGPGFINFFIKPEVWQKQVEIVFKTGSDYGRNEMGKGKKARVELVSANPTGPLHFGNARGGPIGDVISSVLEFSGYKVLREYIDNDRGNQVLELGKTLAVRAGFLEAEEESLVYKGEYTKDLASEVADEIDTSKLSEGEIITRTGELGVKVMFEEIIRDCEAMGIKFDYIVHESDLQKKAHEVLAELEKKGFLKKAEGAVWFAPRNEFLKDKDAVVIKSDGSYTYFTADVVYHKEKFTSGYDLVVDVFGSNTSGHVPKLQALAEVFGFDLRRFLVFIYQFVRIRRGNEVVRMSKRAGNFVTAREVLDEVGRDAFRFYILMHDPDTHMDFDLELAKKKSKENPVYYVQYAHARICSILAKAGPAALYPQPTASLVLSPASETTTLDLTSSKELSPGARWGSPSRVTRDSKSQSSTVKYQLLSSSYELDLIKQITRLPELVEDTCQNFAVHRLTSYAIDLADSFHRFYENCPVINKDKQLKSARLVLVRVTQIAFANTLELLGVSAPERM